MLKYILNMYASETKRCLHHEEQRHKLPFQDFILGRFGFKEVPQEEVDAGIATELAYSAYQARTALRLGREASFVYDPKQELNSNQFEGRDIDLFRQILWLAALKRDYMHLAAELFPAANEIHIKGIIGRITNFPNLKLQSIDLYLQDKERVEAAFMVVSRELTVNPETKPKRSALIIAHTTPPDYKKFNTQFRDSATDETEKKGKMPFANQIGEMVQIGFMLSTAPYLWASIQAAELEREGFDEIRIVDFNSFINTNTETLLSSQFKTKPEIALIAGVTSFDAQATSVITGKLKNNNIPAIIGGIAPTIDPNFFLLTTQAHVMIGEGENAIGPILNKIATMDHANPQRYVFTRSGFNPSSGKKLAQGQINGVQTSEAKLNIEPTVNMDEYYSAENERKGQFAARMKYDYAMTQPIFVGGKWWEVSKTFLEQLMTSRGCPVFCPFCSTSLPQAHRMRRIPLESMEMTIKASEARGYVILDQNFPALENSSQKKSHEQWTQYMRGFFTLMRKHNKKVVCQSDTSFADRIAADPILTKLVPRVVVGMLVGLEQQDKLEGTGSRKTPTLFEKQLRIFYDLGIPIVGTAVPGLPKENTAEVLTSQNDEKVLNKVRSLLTSILQPLFDSARASTPEEIQRKKEAYAFYKWLAQYKTILPLIFPAVNFRGTQNGAYTEVDAENPFHGYYGFKKNGGDEGLLPEGSMILEESLKQFLMITPNLYSVRHTVERMVAMLGNYSFKRIALVAAIQAMASAAYRHGMIDIARTARVETETSATPRHDTETLLLEPTTLYSIAEA